MQQFSKLVEPELKLEHVLRLTELSSSVAWLGLAWLSSNPALLMYLIQCLTKDFFFLDCSILSISIRKNGCRC